MKESKLSGGARTSKVKMVYFCQVDGCKSKLSNVKQYCVRYRVCQAHLAASSVQLQGEECRFCQQCGKFHALKEFDGSKRSCRIRLQHHNNSRMQRRKEAQLLQHRATTDLLQKLERTRPTPERRSSSTSGCGTEAIPPPADIINEIAPAAAVDENEQQSSSETNSNCTASSGRNTSATGTGSSLSGQQQQQPQIDAGSCSSRQHSPAVDVQLQLEQQEQAIIHGGSLLQLPLICPGNAAADALANSIMFAAAPMSTVAAAGEQLLTPFHSDASTCTDSAAAGAPNRGHDELRGSVVARLQATTYPQTDAAGNEGLASDTFDDGAHAPALISELNMSGCPFKLCNVPGCTACPPHAGVGSWQLQAFPTADTAVQPMLGLSSAAGGVGANLVGCRPQYCQEAAPIELRLPYGASYEQVRAVRSQDLGQQCSWQYNNEEQYQTQYPQDTQHYQQYSAQVQHGVQQYSFMHNRTIGYVRSSAEEFQCHTAQNNAAVAAVAAAGAGQTTGTNIPNSGSTTQVSFNTSLSPQACSTMSNGKAVLTCSITPSVGSTADHAMTTTGAASAAGATFGAVAPSAGWLNFATSGRGALLPPQFVVPSQAGRQPYGLLPRSSHPGAAGDQGRQFSDVVLQAEIPAQHYHSMPTTRPTTLDDVWQSIAPCRHSSSGGCDRNTTAPAATPGLHNYITRHLSLPETVPGYQRAVQFNSMAFGSAASTVTGCNIAAGAAFTREGSTAAAAASAATMRPVGVAAMLPGCFQLSTAAPAAACDVTPGYYQGSSSNGEPVCTRQDTIAQRSAMTGQQQQQQQRQLQLPRLLSREVANSTTASAPPHQLPFRAYAEQQLLLQREQQQRQLMLMMARRDAMHGVLTDTTRASVDSLTMPDDTAVAGVGAPHSEALPWHLDKRWAAFECNNVQQHEENALCAQVGFASSSCSPASMMAAAAAAAAGGGTGGRSAAESAVPQVPSVPSGCAFLCRDSLGSAAQIDELLKALGADDTIAMDLDFLGEDF